MKLCKVGLSVLDPAQRISSIVRVLEASQLATFDLAGDGPWQFKDNLDLPNALEGGQTRMGVLEDRQHRFR